MSCSTNRYLSFSLLCSIIPLAAMLLTGCVTPIPLAQEAPDLSYKVTESMVVSVIDDREFLEKGKPPTFIGRAHGTFGIPSDMQAYPWFVSDKSKKGQTLAQALEERIVLGLNDEGWNLTAAGVTTRPTNDEAESLMTANNAQGLLLLSITQWFASINLNWVSAFNFEWGYELDILDAQGAVVTSITDSGTDVVDEEAKQSAQNLIKMAYRERLIKIFERPEVKGFLSKSGNTENIYLPPKQQLSKAHHQTNSPLTAVNATDRENCEFITSITRGAGGTGDVSKHVKHAMTSALTEATNKGADSYFVVSVDESNSGSSVVLDALRCK